MNTSVGAADGNCKIVLELRSRKEYNIGMKGKKEIIKIKVNQTELRNELHFAVQRDTRMNIFRDRKKYRRKIKHKNKQTEID